MAEAAAAQPEDYEDDPIRDAREAFRQAGETLMDLGKTVIFILAFTGNTAIATGAIMAALKKEMQEYLKNPWDRSVESDRGLADLLGHFSTSELLLQQSQILTRLFNLIHHHSENPEIVKDDAFMNLVNNLQRLYVWYDTLVIRSEDKTILGNLVSKFGYTAYKLFRHLKPGPGKSHPEIIEKISEFLTIFRKINAIMHQLMSQFPREARSDRERVNYNGLIQKLIDSIEELDDDIINSTFMSVGHTNPEAELEDDDKQKIFYDDNMKFNFELLNDAKRVSMNWLRTVQSELEKQGTMEAYRLYTTTFGVNPYIQRYVSAIASAESGVVIDSKWLKDNKFKLGRTIFKNGEQVNNVELISDVNTALYDTLHSSDSYPLGDNDIANTKKEILDNIRKTLSISHSPGKWVKWGETSTRAKTDVKPKIDKAVKRMNDYIRLCDYFFSPTWEGHPDPEKVEELKKLIKNMTHVLNPMKIKDAKWHGDAALIEESSRVYKLMFSKVDPRLGYYLGLELTDMGQDKEYAVRNAPPGPAVVALEDAPPFRAPVSPFRAPPSPGQTADAPSSPAYDPNIDYGTPAATQQESHQAIRNAAAGVDEAVASVDNIGKSPEELAAMEKEKQRLSQVDEDDKRLSRQDIMEMTCPELRSELDDEGIECKGDRKLVLQKKLLQAYGYENESESGAAEAVDTSSKRQRSEEEQTLTREDVMAMTCAQLKAELDKQNIEWENKDRKKQLQNKLLKTLAPKSKKQKGGRKTRRKQKTRKTRRKLNKKGGKKRKRKTRKHKKKKNKRNSRKKR